MIAVGLVALAVVMWGPVGAGAAEHSPHVGARVADASSSYYVLLLTNVEDNVYVGTEASLQGVNACDLPDGGPSPCSDPVTYTVQLGPYATCAQATAAYNAAATDPHPAFGGTKVYIFGGSYFIDDMSSWCAGGSSTTTTPTTTTPATRTTTTSTSTTAPSISLPPLAKTFCTSKAAAAAVRSVPATVCAPHKTLSAAEKTEARTNLRGALFLTLLFCGGIYHGGVGGYAGVFSNVYVSECPKMIDLMGDILTEVQDPPLPSYEEVALLVPQPAPGAPKGACPSTASASSCAALKKAAATYGLAVTYSDEVTAAESLTLDRFAAAVAANSPSGAFLQNALAKVYGGAVDGDLAIEQQDGKALAVAFAGAGSNASVAAAAAAQELSSPTSTVFTTSVLNQLVANGVAATPAQARQDIVAQLTGVSGTINASQLLKTGAPTAPAYGTPYFAITLSDVEAIVKGLAAQGTVKAAIATTLYRKLSTASEACGRSGFATAVKGFTTSAGADVPGPAGQILSFAARALTASSRSVSPCT